MRKSAFLAPILLLAACGEPASKYETDAAAPPAPAPAVLPAPPPPPAFVWSRDAEGRALVLKEKDAEVLSIACVPGEGLVVYGARLKPIGSEERLSVGAGSVVVALVATATADRDPPAVKATGPLDIPLLVAIEKGGGQIAASYGAQRIGPVDPPPQELAKAFAAGCRGAEG